MGSGFVWWLTGLSGSGKSTLARALAMNLRVRGKTSYIIDGDDLRRGLSAGLGFSNADRLENGRRAAEAARMMCDAGVYVCVALISPFESGRQQAQDIIGLERFAIIWVNTPLNICIERDVKGLYAKALAGEITGFTGIDAPYEEPEQPRWRVNANGTHTPGELINPVVGEVLSGV
jgi:bifunctional enzyme CysN/CysC